MFNSWVWVSPKNYVLSVHYDIVRFPVDCVSVVYRVTISFYAYVNNHITTQTKLFQSHISHRLTTRFIFFKVDVIGSTDVLISNISCCLTLTTSLCQEVENFHLALSRMADDIIVLKTQVLTLEAENSQLCFALSEHQDLKTDLLDDSDINSMTQAEVSTHIGLLLLQSLSYSQSAVCLLSYIRIEN